MSKQKHRKKAAAKARSRLERASSEAAPNAGPPAAKAEPDNPRATPPPETTPSPPRGAWGRLQERLSLPPMRARTRTVLAMIALAWTLAVVIRVIWMGGFTHEQWHDPEGNLLLTTNDAYYYASGVRDAVETSDPTNRRVPGLSDNVLVTVGAAITKALPVSVEWVTIYLSVLFAGLLAIPLVLIGRLLGSAWWGWSAALIAVIAYSYYARTIPGYFDTDMVSVTLPMAIVGFLMAALKTRRHRWATCAAVLALAAPYFHHGSGLIVAAIALTLAGFVAVFDRKPAALAAAVAFLVVFLPLPWPVRLALIAAVHVAATRATPPKWVWPATAAGVLGVTLITSPAIHTVIHAIPWFRPTWKGADTGGISFVGAGGTIIENANLDLDTLASRISGSVPLFVAAMVGYVLLIIRHPVFLLTAPVFAAGTALALMNGSRFTIYAVPIAALTLTYLAYLVSTYLGRLAPGRERVVAGVCAGLMTVGLVVPAATFALDYKTVPVISRDEVETMRALGDAAKPGDYVVAWWDFGYPLWFYAGVNTLVDGMKNNQDTFIAAEVLFTDSARAAANLSRLAVERYAASPNDPLHPVIWGLIKEWTAEGHKALGQLRALGSARYTPPEATRDVYLYLPWRMLRFAHVVARFRDARGLSEPGDKPRPFALYTPFVNPNQPTVKLSHGYVWDNKQATLTRRGKTIPVNTFYHLSRRKDGTLYRQRRELNPKARVSAVALAHRRGFLLVDRRMLSSVYIQLLVFENDNPYFERVGFHTDAALFRVKR